MAESIWVMFPPPPTMTAVITYAKSDNVRYFRNSTYFTYDIKISVTRMRL